MYPRDASSRITGINNQQLFTKVEANNCLRMPYKEPKKNHLIFVNIPKDRRKIFAASGIVYLRINLFTRQNAECLRLAEAQQLIHSTNIR